MTAAINIQCKPTPIMWVGTAIIPPLPSGLADESGNILADEAGDILTPDP